MIDLARDIRNGIETTCQNVLGASYKKLAFVQDVEKNNYRSNGDRYGVRALAGGQTDTVTKNVTITQTFEVVLTKAYRESNLSDSEQLTGALDNMENMLDIYKELVNTHAGAPAAVIHVTNLQMLEPEYLDDSKVAIQRATLDVIYRFSLI